MARSKCNTRAIWFLSIMTIATFLMAIIIPITHIPNMKKQHREKYRQTPMKVTALDLNPFPDAVKVNCECLNAPDDAGRCDVMVGGLIPGPCNDGEHCCVTIRTCNDVCTGFGKDRKCRVECANECVIGVVNELCYSYLFTSYRPTIHTVFPLVSLDLSETQIADYNACQSVNECNPVASAFDCPACLHIISHTGEMQSLCTDVTNSLECAEGFFNRTNGVGSIIEEAGYNKNNPSVIHFGSAPSWKISEAAGLIGGLITAFVFCALVLLCVICC